ncbi:MAG TPA: DNA repair protein RadC [Limnochordia bacterium]|nr:DNA repair protein RadC [Limnochordia bacterium]
MTAKHGVAGVKALPPAERPRERLIALGPRALGTRELLAIALHTGTGRESALQLADRLLARFGSLARLADASVEELTALHGVGQAKATQVAAAVELGRRLLKAQPYELREGLTTPEAIARLVLPDLADLDREQFMEVLLDTKHQVIAKHLVSVGHLNATLVHPREVFKEAIRRSAAAVVIAHNHPSGDPTPSPEDVALTRRLAAAGELLGIDVLDHVIVARDRYVSLKAMGVAL